MTTPLMLDTTKTYEEHVQELYNILLSERVALDRSNKYYEASYRLETIGFATPPEMECLTAAIGWPRLYVDAIEERLDVESFRMGENREANEEFIKWWQINRLDEGSSMAHLESLIYGRAYISVSAPTPDDPPGVPVIRAESPLHVYAEIDERTRKVTRAIRVYGEYQNDDLRATLFLPNVTVPMICVGGHWIPDGDIIHHQLGVVPIVPMLNRERLADRFGRSEITPEIRSFTDAAARVFMNLAAASEIMAVPQRVFFGVDADELRDESGNLDIEAFIGRVVMLSNESAKAFQFQAAELRNFVDAIEALSKQVAAYTGLPPQYLMFHSDNPASAEAIQSSETRLIKKCERIARMRGGCWEDVMRLGVLVLGREITEDMYRLETVWRNPATPTYAAMADAVMKLYANGMGVIPKTRARMDLGYSDVEIEQMEEMDKEDETSQLAVMLGLNRRTAAGEGGNSSQDLQRRPSASVE